MKNQSSKSFVKNIPRTNHPPPKPRSPHQLTAPSHQLFSKAWMPWQSDVPPYAQVDPLDLPVLMLLLGVGGALVTAKSQSFCAKLSPLWVRG
jgi:hypothetical protein